MADCPEDAHDVLEVWQIVSDPVEMAKMPRDPPMLRSLIQSRHALLMSARPDKQPGRFKSEAKRAASKLFVAPDQVKGTLARRFEDYDSLDTPFARAVFMMFLVSQVHPFVVGNGRIASIMMIAELVTAGEERILRFGMIPPPCGGAIGSCQGGWCGRRESNPHSSRNGILNPARLPIPPRPRHDGL